MIQILTHIGSVKISIGLSAIILDSKLINTIFIVKYGCQNAPETIWNDIYKKR